MKPLDLTKLNLRRRRAVPFAVLALGVVVTCAAAVYVSSTLLRADSARFDTIVRETEMRIRTRFVISAAMLRATNSFCRASYPPAGDSFRAYARGLHLQEQYPGAQGLGFAVRYTPSEQATLIFYMRTHGQS